jgi:Ulp1 protease family, C-terminal catalytic domain
MPIENTVYSIDVEFFGTDDSMSSIRKSVCLRAACSRHSLEIVLNSIKISYSLRPKCVDNLSNEETLQLHIQHASYAHLSNTLNNLTGVYRALSIMQALYIDPEQIIRMRHSNLSPPQIQKELAVQEDRKAQSHFFSSHFFTKLREVPVSNFDEAYAGVQRWSRNVDLFSSKFVFVPIAEHLHWSLAILCNLHALGDTVTAARQKKIQQQQHKQQQKQQQQQHKQEQLKQQQQPFDITDSQTDGKIQECIPSNDDEKAIEAASDVKQKLHCADELTNGNAAGADNTDVSAKTTADTVIEHKTSPPPAAAAAAENVDDSAGGIDADIIDGSNNDSQQHQQQQIEQVDSVTSDIPCILFLDSLSMHQPNRISKYLRLYVEKEWAKTYPNRKPLTLARDELPLVQPSAPMQSNGCDCGVFVLQYAEEMFMRWPAVKGNDAKAALSTEFTHKMFTDKVIVRKRKEIRQLLDGYKGVYQSRIKEDKAAKAVDKQKRAQEPTSTDQQMVSTCFHMIMPGVLTYVQCAGAHQCQ